MPELAGEPVAGQEAGRHHLEGGLPEVLDEGGVENEIILTLDECFARFDPAKGRQDVAVEDRFVAFFRGCFRRRLRDTRRDQKSRERRRALDHYKQFREALVPSTRRQDEFREWARFLFGQALRRLSREAQTYVRLHVIEGKTVEEAAARMRLSWRGLNRWRLSNPRIDAVLQRGRGRGTSVGVVAMRRAAPSD